MLHENGAERDQFMWSQSRKEAVLRVWVPPGTKAKDVSVEHQDGRLTVRLKSEVVVSGELANAIKVEADTGELPFIGGVCRELTSQAADIST